MTAMAKVINSPLLARAQETNFGYGPQPPAITNYPGAKNLQNNLTSKVMGSPPAPAQTILSVNQPPSPALTEEQKNKLKANNTIADSGAAAAAANQAGSTDPRLTN